MASLPSALRATKCLGVWHSFSVDAEPRTPSLAGAGASSSWVVN